MNKIKFKTKEGFSDYKIYENGTIISMKYGKEKEVKQEVIRKNKTNYRRVTLSMNGKTKRFQVHRLIAELFVKKEDKTFNVVNHINNNGEDNRYENLEWTNQSGNMIHSQKQGRLLSSQSAAGLESGRLNTIKTKERHSKYIGKTYNGWKVLKIFKRNNRYTCSVTCPQCKNIKELELYDIINEKATICRECFLKNKSETKKHKKKSYISTVKVLQFDMDLNLINEFKNTYEAIKHAKRIGCKYPKIRAACTGERKSTAGYIWKYKDEEIVESA